MGKLSLWTKLRLALSAWVIGKLLSDLPSNQMISANSYNYANDKHRYFNKYLLRFARRSRMFSEQNTELLLTNETIKESENEAVKKIFQIYLTDNNQSLPDYFLKTSGLVKNNYPDYAYELYSNESLRNFIKAYFTKAVLEAYDSLAPYAYKADLGRYCLLYIHGGWYFDISITILNAIKANDDVIAIAFRDIQRHSGTSWACSNGALYSKPGNPVFLDAIKTIVNNCQTENYGISPLCPTGPSVLGKCFAQQESTRKIIFGDVTFLTPGHSNMNTALVMPDGTIFALLKPAQGGDLKSLGAEGTNNYNVLYENGKIYKT